MHKICYWCSLKSPHRGNSNVHSQFNSPNAYFIYSIWCYQPIDAARPLQDVKLERDNLKSNSSFKNDFKDDSDFAHESDNKDGVIAQVDRSKNVTSQIVLGNCKTADNRETNRETDQSSQHRKLDSEDSTILLCQYCLQDYRSSDAITYCMDCGLYMCATCRRYHQKFVGTRGHSVAVQQELIPTEFDEYIPPVVEDIKESKLLKVSFIMKRLVFGI